MKYTIIALMAFSVAPALAQEAPGFHMTAGRIEISGLENQGTVFEIGQDFGPVTIALLHNQEYATQQAQDVKAGWGGYATFNFVQSEAWTAGVGVAYLDYKVTDHHRLRALFGVPPVTGDAEPVSAGIAINRRFGPVLIGLRHFGFTTLSVGVAF